MEKDDEDKVVKIAEVMEKKDNKKEVVRNENIKDNTDYDDDDDCYEIDPICEAFTNKFTFQESADVALVAEKGSVALRDYPHPRHLCGNFTFNTTDHESYCSKCFCYVVCEIAAPCLQWKGINGHCNVSKRKHIYVVSDSEDYDYYSPDESY